MAALPLGRPREAAEGTDGSCPVPREGTALWKYYLALEAIDECASEHWPRTHLIKLFGEFVGGFEDG